MQNSPSEIAIRLWGNHKSRSHIKTPSGKAFTLLNLPYYYAGLSEEEISLIEKFYTDIFEKYAYKFQA